MTSGQHKLYATDTYNLGSVFPCDWQGVPKIQEYLVPTTYVSPPIIDEFDEETETIVECGNEFHWDKNSFLNIGSKSYENKELKNPFINLS